MLRAKIGGDAADTDCGSDCGAAGGAVGAHGWSAGGRGAGVRHGVLPRPACQYREDEVRKYREERRDYVHDGMRVTADGDLCAEQRVTENFAGAGPCFACDEDDARNICSDDDFEFCRALPSSV